MTLGNMRELGVRGLAVHCLNHACRHQAVICVDDYADAIDAPVEEARFADGSVPPPLVVSEATSLAGWCPTIG
jgi:hypothetical protein